MKRLLAVILSVLMITVIFSGCSHKEYSGVEAAEGSGDNMVRVVSFNCAAPWGNVLKGTGSGARVKRFAAYMNAVKPDSIGTQEMNSTWLEKLGELMPEYDSYGVKRGGDDSESKSEMNAVFWLKDKYECVLKNTFWLSETPDTESKFEGAGCYRICSYVMLHNLENDSYILHMNTHLDNASDEARAFGAKVIMNKLDEIKATSEIGVFTVVISGDMNTEENTPAYLAFANEMQDTRLAAPITQTGTTYHAWGTEEWDPIDFIFTDNNTTVKQFKHLDDTSNGFVSDHYGIMADFSVNK